MEELVVQGGFDYFVRMFGQGPNGEVYVLASQRGVPEGDTGAVFELVPRGGRRVGLSRPREGAGSLRERAKRVSGG